jgi:hypothetical protein
LGWLASKQIPVLSLSRRQNWQIFATMKRKEVVLTDLKATLGLVF